MCRSVFSRLLAQACLIAFTTLTLAAGEETAGKFSLSTYQYTVWHQREGAPEKAISVAQTEDGWLWFAGESGLYRFDGARFERVTAVQGQPLQSDAITKILAEGNKLWVGYLFGGVDEFDGGKVTHHGDANGLPTGALFEIKRSPTGVLHVAATGGIAQLVGKRWQLVPIADKGCSFTNSIEFDQEGGSWLRCGTNTVYGRFGNEPAYHPVGDRIAHQYFFDSKAPGVPRVRADLPRTMFATDWRGKSFEYPKMPPNRTLGEFAILPNGNLVLLYVGSVEVWPSASATAPLFRLDGSSPGLSGSLAESFIDKEGNYWFTTTDGVIRARRNLVTHVERFADILTPGVTAAAGGKVWLFGFSARDALELGADGSYQQVAISPVATAAKQNDDSYWFGGTGQVWQIERGKQTAWPLPEDADHRNVQSIAAAADGTVWASVVKHGVYKLSKGQWSRLDPKDGIAGKSPLSLFVDAKQRLWMGYPSNDVFVQDGGKVSHLGEKEGLQLGKVLCFFERDGVLWLGGEKGVAWFRDGKFHTLRTRDPAAFRGTSGIVMRASGELWLNGNEGMARIDTAEIERALAQPGAEVQFERIDYEQGLSGRPAQLRPTPTLVEAGDGRLWYATMREVGWLDPNHLPRNPYVVPVQITGLVADDQPFVPGPNIKLAPNTDSLQINFTALGLTIPERLRFKYRLEGYDRDWQDVGNRRVAYYTQLPPGDYRFQVLAANEDGVWNKTGASMAFTLPPTFVQTRWFTALWVCALLLLAGLLYLWRMRQLTARLRERMVERQQERDRIARALHDTLLQGVQGLILKVQAGMDAIQAEDRQRGIKIIDTSLEYATNLLSEGRDQVAELRDGGELKGDLPCALQALVQELAQQYGVPMVFDEEGTNWPLQVPIAAEAYVILREALTNAAVHARASVITLRLQFDARSLVAEVRDDGCGIAGLARDGGKREGHWGLPGMRERAQKIGGELQIESVAGEGTVVRLTLRKSRVHAGKRRFPLGLPRLARTREHDDA
ncbi:sensor histidine kinase [Chitinimonas sp.]|uniref:sensor histidine kinase n=1 Tax=Chitinimonas sp. TaxID=1934313 RepID=UPI002F943895